MPWYEHECTECGYEWEDLYGVNTDPPTECPKCGKHSAKRLISVTYGRVQLSGRELQQSVLDAAKVVQKEANKNENLQANLVGESKYEAMVQRREANRKNGGT